MGLHRRHVTAAAGAVLAAAATAAGLPGEARAASAAHCEVDMTRTGSVRVFEGTSRCVGTFGRSVLTAGRGSAVARLSPSSARTCASRLRVATLELTAPRPFSFFEPTFAELEARVTMVKVSDGVSLVGSGVAEGERVIVGGGGTGCHRLRLAVEVGPRTMG